MSYQFDLYGWYCGQGNGPRSTPVEPPILSIDDTPGQPRANWTGREWVVWPFVPWEMPAPAKPPVPDVVTPRQAKLALLQAGLLDDVEAAIAAIEDPALKRVAEIEWEYAHEIRRDWPLLVQLAGVIGLTDEQVDELFVVAAGL